MDLVGAVEEGFKALRRFFESVRRKSRETLDELEVYAAAGISQAAAAHQ